MCPILFETYNIALFPNKYNKIMEVYIILSGIGLIFRVLSLGRLLRLILLKILFKNITIKELESFEKNSRQKYFWNKK